ncbi:MAG: LCP family protein [Saccharofermentans sp.]|nr:LCP family protein [Saccharofermentans sp.]
MATKTTNNKAKIIVVVLILGIIAIVGGVVVALLSTPSASLIEETQVVETGYTIPTSTTVEADYDNWGDSVVYNGVTYYPNHHLTTLLFMGVDQNSDYESSELIGNGCRADTIMLFILDNENNTLDILEVNRDTWSPVDVYDHDRNYLYSGDMQLCLQYSFADSPTRSCMLMKSKVSSLLYGVGIDYYCSLTLDGMRNVVEAMGGLPVTFDENLSFIDPAFVEGATVVLTPEQAERLFRYRDITQTGSNQGRMSRAAFVMQQLFDTMVGTDSETLQTYYDAAGDGLTTDADADTLYSIRTYQLNNIYTFSGTYQTNTYDEFYIDEDALQEMVIDLFYVEAE